MSPYDCELCGDAISHVDYWNCKLDGCPYNKKQESTVILKQNTEHNVTWSPRPPDITSTYDLIKTYHAGQKDKSGVDYYVHCVNVMNRLPVDASEAERMVALLHDTLEDTELTEHDLVHLGYSAEVIDAVKLLTRPQGVNKKAYLDWIRDIAASGNRMAIRVKIADNEDNATPARVATLPDDFKGIIQRYEKSLAILRPALLALDGTPATLPLISREDVFALLVLLAPMLIVAVLVSPLLATRLSLFFALVFVLVRTLAWMSRR